MTRRRVGLLPAGSLPYVAPYGLFLALVQLQAALPSAAAPLFALRVAAPAALLAFFWRRGAYGELRGYRGGAGAAADVAVGVALAALWIAPYWAAPALPRGEPFDPGLLAGSKAMTLGLRLLGFAAVTPFVEELFVRSFLLRFVDAERSGGDFRREPIGRFAWPSFFVTTVWFTASHAPWEWWVALPTGVALNLWLVRRRQLGACVVAHATANAAIWGIVVLGPGSFWELL